MRVHHVTTNVSPWGPTDHLSRLDTALQDSGSVPIPNLYLGSFELCEDGDHYTKGGLTLFAVALERVLSGMECPLVVSDSTIDWHNYNKDWKRTGWADSILTLYNPRMIVDSVCGSGFVALSSSNDHFYTRVSRHLRTNKNITDVVLVGGWNDIGRTEEACRCIRRLVSMVQRY